MVDALHEVHRVLAPAGILIDARPDSRVLAVAERRKERGFQRFGTIKTNHIELANDRASDDAIARVVRQKFFRRHHRTLIRARTLNLPQRRLGDLFIFGPLHIRYFYSNTQKAN